MRRPNSRLGRDTGYNGIARKSQEAAIRPLIIGTRGSQLALRQVDLVVDRLRKHFPEQTFTVQVIKTLGDRVTNVPLNQFGSTGVFVNDIAQLLLAGAIDLAVHSLKDVPSDESPGLALAAFPERSDPRDVIVSRSGARFADLPAGARIGTSSARRRAQLRHQRPDLDYCEDLRGNVDTRLGKLFNGDYEAIVLAAAGIERLGRASEIAEYLAVDVCLPDVGQGTLAIQVADRDPEVAELVGRIDDPAVRAMALAERAVLRAFGAGCKIPVAAYAEVLGEQLELRGLVATVDGSRLITARALGPVEAPEAVGIQVWEDLVRAGAGEILAGAIGA